MNIWSGMKVMVTGHTGFKGSWLSLWLIEMGAEVVGYSLAAEPYSHFNLIGLKEKVVHIEGDIRDGAKLEEAVHAHQPNFIFHLAAQPLVLPSYEIPAETFEINVQGTVNILEAVRNAPFVRGMVVVTTDKCYENREWCFGYRENDVLGGKDPYSASKAMAEMAVQAYQSSFGLNVATARAGNVIGGGDFSPHRIIPDMVKTLLRKEPLLLRNPESVRPWLFVLDALHGYLMVGEALLSKGIPFAGAWNFGPLETKGVTVREVVEKGFSVWGEGEWKFHPQRSKKEMGLLRLNWDKASQLLEWNPRLNWEEAVSQTVSWYKACHLGEEPYKASLLQLQPYLEGKLHEVC